mmetsp:Transcript_21550/g.48659  ORF Transcript_21550/g.48659 Transcript_21550/m.48659 type:complete len:104 (-) Transcript_21550:463-774(-)
MVTPKKKRKDAWPDGPPLSARVTAVAQTTPPSRQTHSGPDGVLSLESIVCSAAVVIGEQALMIMLRDSGIKDMDRRLKPMFNEKAKAKQRMTPKSPFVIDGGV